MILVALRRYGAHAMRKRALLFALAVLVLTRTAGGLTLQRGDVIVSVDTQDGPMPVPTLQYLHEIRVYS